jgi:hypothetical protein
VLRRGGINSVNQNIASTKPGSTDIIVDVSPVEVPSRPKMPSGQLGSRAVSGRCRKLAAIIHKAFEKSVNGETQLLRLGGQAGFRLVRNVDTHGSSLHHYL